MPRRGIFCPRKFYLLAAAVCLAGCSVNSPKKSEIRAVTSEIVQAIQKAAGRKAPVTIRPEPASGWGSWLGQPAADNISVTLTNAAQADALRKPLAEIGARHHLDVAETSGESALRVEFSAAGRRTHSIRLQFPPALRAAPPSAGSARTAPRLAIILDDIGNDRAAADSLLALPFPLTISVLPHLPLSSEIADQAARRGDQVMLHLPMQPETTPGEAVELRVGMPPEQVDSVLTGMLETVPHAAGVNNHEGSRATSDPALMDALMPALRDRGLFFIDSRTTASTVAYDAAERYGVRAASRKVFLDDAITVPAIEKQIDLAAQDADRDGEAIAIGHPHPETIAALREMLPRLQRQGIRLVFASDLTR